MLIDRFMPRFDARISRHVLVDADPETTYAALRAVDLAKVRSPLVRGALALRRKAERRRREAHGTEPSAEPTTMTFDDLPRYGRVPLGEEPGREIAIGGVGTLAGPEPVLPSEFEAFERPGFWKGVASLSVQPYGGSRSLLSYEVRMRATDPASERRLHRFLRIARPAIGRVVDRVLDHVRREAEERAAPKAAA